jgi:hypothetical protein
LTAYPFAFGAAFCDGVLALTGSFLVPSLDFGLSPSALEEDRFYYLKYY